MENRIPDLKKLKNLMADQKYAIEHVMDFVKEGSEFIKPETYSHWEKFVHCYVRALYGSSIINNAIELMKLLKEKKKEEAIETFNKLDLDVDKIFEEEIRKILKVCAYNGEEFYTATEYNIAKTVRK